METKAYLYDDTLMKLIDGFIEQNWDEESATDTIRTILNMGFVIRERDPRDEDKKANMVINPRLTEAARGGPVYPLKPYDLNSGMRVNATVQFNEPQDPRPEKAPKAFTEGVR